MIRVNLLIDEAVMPALYQALSGLPPRKRAAYVRSLLSQASAGVPAGQAAALSPKEPPADDIGMSLAGGFLEG